MSKTTLRKRISLVAVTALTAGVLSVVASPASSASHPNTGTDNYNSALGQINNSLFVATTTNNTASYVVSTTGAAQNDGRSKGLFNKDTSSGTAQTATVLAGGVLALYATVNTATAFTATGGSFVGTRSTNPPTVLTGALNGTLFSSDNRTTIRQIGIGATTESVVPAATSVATAWVAPVTAGTYTVSMLTGFYLASNGTTRTMPDLDNLPPTLGGKITVTVVAASAGGSYSSTNSACNTSTAGAAITAGAGTAGIDSTAIVADGGAWYVNLDLTDAYNADLATGNMIATATNGAFVNIGAGGELPAGTTATDLLSSNGNGVSVRVDQPTAGAPLTTTVSVSYNGVNVCTKTVTIRGKAAKLVVDNVGTQNLNAASTAGSNQWMYQKTGVSPYSALFTVVVTDSAGNGVSTPTTYGAYSADATTLTTTVQSLSVNAFSSTASASSPLFYNFGSWGCGSSAGEANVKLKFTIASTGDVITSDAFKARCAGGASTYSASFDKASYTQGELAKLTVSFKDSKGFPANTVSAVGANTMSLPYLTGVDITLGQTNPASQTAVTTNSDGTSVYTLTVGTTAGLQAGTYTGVVEFSAPALGTRQTPTYKLSTGGDTTTNADVLKSIVALIASINKQIQALQKLILKRQLNTA